MIRKFDTTKKASISGSNDMWFVYLVVSNHSEKAWQILVGHIEKSNESSSLKGHPKQLEIIDWSSSLIKRNSTSKSTLLAQALSMQAGPMS